jgi:hypothetical protein
MGAGTTCRSELPTRPLCGEWEQDRYGDGPITYVMKCYRTVVATFTPVQRIGGDYFRPDQWVTDARYSVTTSKHLGKVRAAWVGPLDRG